jgi:UDP-3-O-[3-hydroxymyristoyl] glucosamine N-acyltransferase
MAYTIEQIAAALGADALGAVDIEVESVAEPADAGPAQLALAMKPDYAEGLAQGKARAAMLWHGADWQALGLEAAIMSPRPRFALSGLSAMMDPGQGWGDGVHPSAVVDDTAELGDGVVVGPLAVICGGAKIGAGTVVGPQCFIGSDATIGAQGFLREGVRIGTRVCIGDRFIAQPGAVIGSDGFSYVTPEESGAEKIRQTLGDQGEIKAQTHARIHSLGAVSIGDDVEVGANSGTDCLLCGQVGMAGSVTVGNNVTMAGQTGVADNIFVGDNVITGGATKLMSNVPAGRVMLGYPAIQMDAQMEVYKGLRRLKRLFNDVADLKKTVSNHSQSK